MVRHRAFAPAAALTSAFMLTVAGCAPAGGSDSDDFYASEQDSLEMIVSWSPGGGADTVARLLEPYFADHIAGGPDVGIDYVEGGGGINGHNEFQRRREPDGSTAIMTAASSVVPYLLDEPAVEFDFLDWKPVIGFPTGNMVSVSPDIGVEEPGDLQDPDKPLTLGSIGLLSGDVVGLLALDVLDIDYTTTFGYEGAGDVRNAFERGEINVTRDGTVAYRNDMQQLVDEGSAVPLFTTGYIEDGELVRDPAFPDHPTVEEVHEDLYGEAPSGELWDLYLAIIAPMTILEKGLWYHQDVPEEAVEAARDAAGEFANNEEFLEDVTEINGPYEPLVGEALDEAAEEAFAAIDSDLQEQLREHMEREHDLAS